VAQIYPRALGSISVASYDSQGYGEGILSLLHTGRSLPELLALRIRPQHRPHRKRCSSLLYHMAITQTTWRTPYLCCVEWPLPSNIRCLPRHYSVAAGVQLLVWLSFCTTVCIWHCSHDMYFCWKPPFP
jgi:hypothetical protein